MILDVKYCKSENEFHIPLLGGDKGVGLKRYSFFSFTIFYQ